MTINGHFDWIKPGNVWTGIASSADQAALAAQVYQAVNGDGGGTYAPSTPLVFGGTAGFAIASTIWALGTASLPGSGGRIAGAVGLTSTAALTFADGAKFAGTLTFDSLAIKGTASVQSGAVITLASGATISVASGATFTVAAGASFAVNSSAAFNGAVGFNGAVSHNGSETFAGAVALNGTTTRTGAMVVSGGAAATGWRRVDGPDSGASYGAVNSSGVIGADEVRVAGLTGNHIYVISTTGAIDGARIRFASEDTSYIIQISLGTSTISLGNSSGRWQFAEITYSAASGSWYQSGGYFLQ